MRPGAYQHLAELVIPADERAWDRAYADAYPDALPDYIQRYGSDELLDALVGEWGRAA